MPGEPDEPHEEETEAFDTSAPVTPEEAAQVTRTDARRAAFLAIFAIQFAQATPVDALETLPARNRRELAAAASPFARQIVEVAAAHTTDIEGYLAGVLQNWKLDRIAAAERAILTLATAELLYVPGIPPRVTINEAIELAKRYCDTEGPKFVNGVLDRLAHVLKKIETAP